MSVLGIDRYETSVLKCWVHIEYDPGQLGPTQIIEILDTALANTEHPSQLDKINLDLAISTVSVPLAATAQFAVPALLPVAAAVFAYTAIPSFRGAYRVLLEERRLGVDLLDSIRRPGLPRYRANSSRRGPCREVWPSAAFWCAGPKITPRGCCWGFRQAGALCVAAEGRRRDPVTARSGCKGATSSSSALAKWCRSTASSWPVWRWSISTR